MRLLRRTLLCLVVGVTAFGVAGWVFRQRPDWEVAIGEDDQGFYFARRDDADDDEAPIWLYARNGVVEGEFAEGSDVVGVHPDGRRFHQSRMFIGDFDEPLATAEGGFACHCGMRRDDQPFQTHFTMIGRTGEVEIARAVNGRWEGTGDGAHAFRLLNEPTTSYESIDLRSGRVTKLPINGIRKRLDHYNTAVSPDGRFLALNQSLRGEAVGYLGVELIDIETGKTVRTIAPPSPGRGGSGSAAVSTFLLQGRAIEYFWYPPGNEHFYETWRQRLDVTAPPTLLPAGAPRRSRGPSRPSRETRVMEPPKESELMDDVYEVGALADGRRFWQVRSIEPYASWFALDEGPQSNGNWRPFPFPAVAPPRRGMEHYIYHLPRNVDGEIRAAQVPGREALIVWNNDPPKDSLVPSGLANWVPKSWQFSGKSFIARWHDWKRNEWRQVFNSRNAHDLQVRRNALLAVSRVDGRTLLQSWPLPPRDPKWPALGIATLCTAATWWLCARRYARRLKNSAQLLPASA